MSIKTTLTKTKQKQKQDFPTYLPYLLLACYSKQTFLYRLEDNLIVEDCIENTYAVLVNKVNVVFNGMKTFYFVYLFILDDNLCARTN